MRKLYVSRAIVAAAAVATTACNASAATGPNSSQTPYLLGVKPGIDFVSILSAGDTASNGYKMAGTPDGLGAMDNGDGSFTLFMNHEFTNTDGVPRSHGNTLGAFVSQWTINKSTLAVTSGRDQIQTVFNANTGAQVTGAALNFSRFCSADLPAPSAFFNAATGLGTTERLYMNGEEVAGGRAMAHVVTGPNAGKSYVLPSLGAYSWENYLANAASGDKTFLVGTDDGSGGTGTSAARGLLSVYVGTKTNAGSEPERAGLTNGTVGYLKVGNLLAETRASGVGSPKGVSQPFTVVSSPANGTGFLRPEDGAWDPSHPNDFYFVTTDQYDQVKDGVGTQIGRSRLWKAHFDDVSNPNAGGNFTMLLDGTEQGQMFDNIAIDTHGHIVLLEDVGGNPHNGKIWAYDIPTGGFTMIGKHDPARFGDLGQAATSPFNQDEETSGVIDAEPLLGRGWFLIDDQAHYPLGAGAPLSYEVEGGQLMAMYIPDSAFVPEPTTGVAMAGIGLLLSARRRRRARA
jgi:hypothetical protein